MGSLFSLVTGWKGYAALALACLLAGSLGTWRVMSWREGAQETKFAVQQIKLIDKDLQINLQLGDLVVKGVQVINTETVHIVREIPQHVTPEIDSHYPVPLGFIRVWNAQTDGPVPPTAAGSDADPSGTPISAVAYAHAQDTDTLKKCELALDSWWSWYDQHKAARK